MGGMNGQQPEKERQRTLGRDSARELNDEALAEEIMLLGDLVLAASSVARHLTQDEVDQVLKQDPPTREPLPGAGGTRHTAG